MKLDIRLPLGLLFLVFGVVLGAYGLLGNKAIYDRSLDINVNLWWGLVMLVFGLIMVVMGRRGERGEGSDAAPADDARGSGRH